MCSGLLFGCEEYLTLADIDSDRDGLIDRLDAFPDDPNETADTDGDGMGDNADAQPNDANACEDSDDDGCDDCASGSVDPSNDGTDTSGDGLCDACSDAHCGGNGDCSPDDSAIVCTCDAGFEGADCTVDIDSCADADTNDANPCNANDAGATCVDNQAPFVTYTCTCTAGFGFDGSTCVDAPACADGDAMDGNPCNSLDDGATCSDEAPPSTDFTCMCGANQAYTGEDCTEDVDACAAADAIDNNPCNGDDASAACTDAVAPLAGYNCMCTDGFEESAGTCVNIDECVAQDNPCNDDDDVGGSCGDSIGSYRCRCSTGFEDVGGACMNIDECVTQDDPCDDNGDTAATCVDTPGDYTCNCTGAADYQFVGGSCIDANYSFATCGSVRDTGPAQGDCDTAYTGTQLDGEVTVTSGYQVWTVPFDGTFQITAAGAQGGGTSANEGGRGAEVRGDFALAAGQQLVIVVGQQGYTNPACADWGGGGGGGTYVARVDAAGDTVAPLGLKVTPLIIAGGGGGSSDNANGCSGQDQTDFDAFATTSGTGGGGSMNVDSGGGGAGYSGNGAFRVGDARRRAAISFLNGARGGWGDSTRRTGGFGGGGGPWNNGGSGGGYTGGSSTPVGGPVGISGGGYSFNSGTSQVGIGGTQVGAGAVSIVVSPL